MELRLQRTRNGKQNPLKNKIVQGGTMSDNNLIAKLLNSIIDDVESGNYEELDSLLRLLIAFEIPRKIMEDHVGVYDATNA